MRVFTDDAADPGGDGMQIGVRIPDFTFPAGPDHLGADLAAIARAADDGGSGFLGGDRDPGRYTGTQAGTARAD